MKQTMLIVGLGLIGGSLALALKGFEDFEIVGVDVLFIIEKEIGFLQLKDVRRF